MSLADALGIGTADGALLGGFIGFLASFEGLREFLDNGQRGAFAGAYFGSLAGAIIRLASETQA
jgi:hypothetical protein